jgi:outer membrane receptor protein involved in Fe transport
MPAKSDQGTVQVVLCNFFLTCLILLSCFSGASSQDLPADTSVAGEEEIWDLDLERLMDVKVSSGSFLDLSLKNSALSLTIITKEQIELSGARHMSELLEIYVPGFQYMINKWNGIIWGMRGIAVDRNTKFIYLVNGFRMNTEARDGANMELDLGMLGDIQRVEVIRGPAGYMYGSGAIAGVINVVTRKYQKDQIIISTRQGAWSGEQFYNQFEGDVQAAINENSNIILSGGYRRSDGIGEERGRLWGRPSFPYPIERPDPPAQGVPVSGSTWETPGNYRMSADFNYKRFRYYGRYTHQVTSASGFMIVDPWPDYMQGDTTAPDRLVDGQLRSPDSSFYGAIEPFNNNRRQYVVNNLSNQFLLTVPDGKNEILLAGALDMNTNRIQYQDLKGYVNSFPAERNTFIAETFGERRYTLGGLYLLKSPRKFQLASGYQFRFFDIGNDMSGRNSQEEKATHPVVSNVDYYSHAFYSEGIYNFSKMLNAQFALRYSLHTRTIDMGGVFTPKFAVVVKPSENHSVKLIYQISANNGSADNYEFNRFTLTDEGKPFSSTQYSYDPQYRMPGPGTIIKPPVTEQELHSLKPERSVSWELTSMHKLGKITVLPSLSYTTVENLFTWNQYFFRIINAGKFSFGNAELDLKWSDRKGEIGISHVFTRLMNTDVNQGVAFEVQVFEGYDSVAAGGGRYLYTPRPVKSVADPSKDSVRVVYVRSIRDQISVDGKNFLNLNTNITKIYIDYKLNPWATVHADARLFWGLRGRKEIHTYDTSAVNNPALDEYRDSYANNTKYPYLGVHHRMMVKLNLSVKLDISERLSFSLHGYDLLAGTARINTLRWQQTADSRLQTDLYAVDFTSFIVSLRYSFGL